MSMGILTVTWIRSEGILILNSVRYGNSDNEMEEECRNSNNPD